MFRERWELASTTCRSAALSEVRPRLPGPGPEIHECRPPLPPPTPQRPACRGLRSGRRAPGGSPGPGGGGRGARRGGASAPPGALFPAARRRAFSPSRERCAAGQPEQGAGARAGGRTDAVSRQTPSGRQPHAVPARLAPRGRQQPVPGEISRALPAPAPVPAPGGRLLPSDRCLSASERPGTMKLLPSVVLKLFLAAGKRAADAPGDRGDGDAQLGAPGKVAAAAPGRATWWGPYSLAAVRGDQGSGLGVLMWPRPSPAVVSALVTGESLERLQRGLAAETSNLDSPTESPDQLLPPGGGGGREVLGLQEADLDLFRGGCGGCPRTLVGSGRINDSGIRAVWAHPWVGAIHGGPQGKAARPDKRTGGSCNMGPAVCPLGVIG